MTLRVKDIYNRDGLRLLLQFMIIIIVIIDLCDDNNNRNEGFVP